MDTFEIMELTDISEVTEMEYNETITINSGSPVVDILTQVAIISAGIVFGNLILYGAAKGIEWLKNNHMDTKEQGQEI